MSRHKRQPRLDCIRVSILHLHQSAHRDPLEILLTLLEDEVGARDGPALCYAREGDGTPAGQTHVVCGAHGEVGVQKEGPDRVAAQLEVGDGDAVGGGTAKGTQVDGLDVERGTQGGEGGLGSGIEGRFVGREGDAAFSVVVLRTWGFWRGRRN